MRCEWLHVVSNEKIKLFFNFSLASPTLVSIVHRAIAMQTVHLRITATPTAASVRAKWV